MECRVCGELEGKPHYGTVCCASCKAFFRRRFLNNEKKECRNGNRCEISASNRKNCSSCRYKKCLEVGLKTEEIRGKRKCSPLPNITTLAIPTSSKFIDISYEDAMRIADMYLNLEL
ncbi:unnamed protein product [Caenorhabditis angaria]|uniref:Nuclear receptor domain-containing protein n=1 Tax=Caenorhabditis angaria TaxID=860376 RepID=A0A9P1N266_9PELO|nr:unnamed protein product [Caenorhabditis angaria]